MLDFYFGILFLLLFICCFFFTCLNTRSVSVDYRVLCPARLDLSNKHTLPYQMIAPSLAKSGNYFLAMKGPDSARHGAVVRYKFKYKHKFLGKKLLFDHSFVLPFAGLTYVSVTLVQRRFHTV